MSTTKEECESRKKSYGFKSEDKSVLDYDSTRKSIELIKSIQFPEKEFITTRAINPKRIIKIARNDFSTLFPQLNRGILHLSAKEFETLQIKFTRNNTSEHEGIQTVYLQARITDIFNIPVNHTLQEQRTGSALLWTPFPNAINNKTILAQFDIGGPSDYLTEIIYQHELVHPLLKRFRGSIEDYYHEEVLPIAIEKISAFENDPTEELLRKMEVFRVRGHQEDITSINQQREGFDERGYQHLISGLIANCIFDRYYNETTTGRRYILDEIQTVLNGGKTLGTFLQEQAVDLSSNEVVTATEHSIQKCLIKK